MPQWNPEPWKYGRSYQTRAGETVYVIRKTIKGRRYEVPLHGLRTPEDAERECRVIFMPDPEAYLARIKGVAATSTAVALNDKSIAAFREYMESKQMLTHTRKRYIKNVEDYLKGWADVLKQRDLRTVRLPEYLKEINRTTKAKRWRVSSIKAFTAWLRETGQLEVSQDATLGLTTPKATSQKSRLAAAGKKKGYEMKLLERVYKAIEPWESKRTGWEKRTPDVQSVRDYLLIRCKTGMHGTEVDRLARGYGTIDEVEGQEEIAATIRFPHKNGDDHVQSIDAQTLAAARRLQTRGSAPVESYIDSVLARATKSLGLGKLNCGALRHSFITWSRKYGRLVRPTNAGLSLEAVAAAVGHRSASTSRRFYDETEVPDMVVVPIKLEHPHDPVPLGRGRAAGAANVGAEK